MRDADPGEGSLPGGGPWSIDHVQVAIPPGGEERARGYWVGLMGFEEQPKQAAMAVRGGAWFRRGAVQVHVGIEADLHPWTKAHIAFRLGSAAAIDALARHLQGAGYAVRFVEDELPGWRRFFSEDPFGNRMEFMAPDRGSPP